MKDKKTKQPTELTLKGYRSIDLFTELITRMVDGSNPECLNILDVFIELGNKAEAYSRYHDALENTRDEMYNIVIGD